MATEPIKMNIIKQVLTGHKNGMSIRELASIHTLSPTTVLKMTHQPGAKMYVDFAGDRLSYHDSARGLDPSLLDEMSTCNYIVKGIPVIITGPTGQGKAGWHPHWDTTPASVDTKSDTTT